ncbi:penicillin-binding transpeptidase domain-containing protein [Papillibacter cinnamivorans]|uniref:Stage V sporulation protein D (Sporulation-specific penicillin-binding protein) n=1 Tax=Papillibacter cinnamivorans DSM 12816 TaxID=1122930 RepID=A0A1W1YZH9_9FIRM|nr:penicillin-binding transpeptidase domain-containing protein [Papillibacter cinnamivorans]SMC41544.1 stage V sporulation protein D (sporulation-specific penicillin-binding protein) [Papillibacter cinnamivorans DSM 12816]
MRKSANGKETPAGRRANRAILSRTLFLLVVFGIMVFAPLFYQLFKLQIVEHEKYENLAVEQQTRSVSVSASRGTIYDTNGNILAISASVETIFISPKEIEENKQDVDLIAEGLSSILGVDADKIREKAAKTNSQYETVKIKVEKDVADQVREFINENNIKGIHLVTDTKRYYPYGTLAAQVIGFVGTENSGLYGVEALYESVLKGQNGLIVTAKNAKGTDLLYKYEQYYDAQNGESLVLTLDTTIQHYVEKGLAEAVEKYNVKNGAFGIAMDINTGAILALANVPNYNLNSPSTVADEDTAAELASLKAAGDESYPTRLADAQKEQWHNKAVSYTYEPGSTFKALTLAMALEEKKVSLSDTFYCSGSITVKGWPKPIKCHKTTGHGLQTLTQAVQNSCNVAFIQIGLKVGAETFYEYVKNFGLLNKTGVDLQSEGGSIFFDFNQFTNPDNLSSLAVASFGQTFKVTPIQLITAEAAVANGGHLMKPYVVKEVLDSDGNTVKTTEPTEVRQVISEETSATVRQILESVVSTGTGKNAYVAGYRIAGKTGTSEKRDEDTGDVVVSFMGFAPADNPQVILLIGLDSPSRDTGYYVSGGVMAAPVAGSILADILSYMGVEPEYTTEELSSVDAVVPQMKGMTLEQAKAALNLEGFSYRVVGSGGTVTDQTPAGGASVPKSAQIVLYMGEDKPTALCTVPSIKGMTAEAANKAITNAGLCMRATGAIAASSSSVSATGQSPAAGEKVEAGTVVTVQFTDTSIHD